MGMFSSLFKVVSYPIARPIKDIKSSGVNVKEAFKQAKEIQQAKKADAKAAAEYLQGMTPQEKFEEIYSLNEWTEQQLLLQFAAARNTRRGMVALTIVGAILLVGVMFTVSTWALAIVGPVTVIFLAGCSALAARYAWWEAQIAERGIYPFAEFIGRRDFFRRVFLP